MAITSSYGLNPLQTLKQKAKQSRFGYDDAAANRFSAQGQLYTYLSSLDKVGKTQEDWQNFLNTYKMYDYMPNDYKDFALMNEAQYKPNNYTEEQLQNLSDEEKKLYNEQTKKSLHTWTDENGQEVSQEMTDYEWNKKLLGWKGEEIHQEQLKQQFEQMQANKGWLQKAWEKTIATDVSILRNIVGGAFDAVGDLYNLLEGAYAAIYAGVTGGDIDEYWREAVGTNELAFIGEAMERATFDWDREMGIRDYYGNKSWLGNMADGISNSFGRMLPTMLISWGGGQIIAARAAGTATALGSTMLNAVDGTSKAMSALSKTSQLLFYASMAQNDITEMLNDEKTASLPSWQIFASAYAGAGMELLVEKGLDKLLGTSVIDAMTYGFNASSKGTLVKAGKDIGKLTKGKVARTVLGRMAFDAFHEGMEEVLQDWSHTFVNGFFETMNYAMGNTEYANIFHDANTFSLQTAIDSFISGAIMSIIGSGFDYIKTKRLAVSSIKTDKEGNIVTDRKGNIKTEKLSKARSWLYKDAMASIDANVNELLTSGKLTAEEKADLVSGLNTSMKTISAIFEGMGQERFAYANKLLQSMSDVLSVKRATNAVYEFVEGTWSDYGVKHLEKVAEKIEQRQLDNPKYNVSRESNLDEVREVTATEKDTIKQIFADCDKVNNIIATDNGTGAVLTEDGTLIVPAAQLQNLDPATIEKDINEQVMVSNITKVPQLKLVIDQIYKMFKELPINKGKKFTKETAITYLLLNPDFAKVCLYTGDVNMVQFISQLDKLVKSLEVSDALTSQHKKMLDDSIDTLKTIYADYCIAMQYADINVDILSDEQRQRITRERWNKDLANRIEAGRKLNEADYRNLENRINSLNIAANEKTNLVTALHSDNKSERIKAFKRLAELQYGQFYSLFDDITYPKDRSLMGITLYNFLRSQGITLQDITKSGTMTIDGETVNVRQYYDSQFAEYTNQQYTLVYDGDKIEVRQKEARPFTSEVHKKNSELSNYGYSGKAKVAVKSTNSDFDRSILKSDINNAYKDIVTINDVINTPSMLTKEVLSGVQKAYGSITSENVYKYLKYDFLNKSNGTRSISVTADGEYVMVDVSDMTNMKSNNFDEVLDDIVKTTIKSAEGDTDAASKLKKGYSIKKLIDKKYLTREEDENVRITVSNSRNSYYDPENNTIYLSKEYLNQIRSRENLTDTQRQKAYIAEVGSIILHEFSHAIQVHNGMNTGLGDFLNKQTNPADAKKVVQDMSEHYDLPKTNAENYINDILYYGTGEAGAYGYEYDPDIKYDTFIRTDLPNGELKITTPWGTTYTTNGSNIEVMKSAIVDVKRKYPDSHYIHKSKENVTTNVANTIFAKFGKSAQTEFETRLRNTRPNAENYKSTTKEQCVVNYINVVEDYAKANNISVSENDLLVEASTFLSRSKYWKDTPNMKDLTNPQAKRLFDGYYSKNAPEYFEFLQSFDNAEYKGGSIKDDYYQLLTDVDEIGKKWRYNANVGTEIKKNGEGARDILFNSITPEVKEKMLKLAYYDLTRGYGVTFDEFLEMDIPYFRFQTSDKIYDNGSFLSAALGEDGYDYLNSYFGRGDRGQSGYLIYGTIKPKDLVGYIPLDMNEGLIKVTDLTKAKGIVSVANAEAMNFIVDKIKNAEGKSVKFEKVVNQQISEELNATRVKGENIKDILTIDNSLFVFPNNDVTQIDTEMYILAHSTFVTTQYDIRRYLNTNNGVILTRVGIDESISIEDAVKSRYYIYVGKIYNGLDKQIKYIVDSFGIKPENYFVKFLLQSDMSGEYVISEDVKNYINDKQKLTEIKYKTEEKLYDQDVKAWAELVKVDKAFAKSHPDAQEINVAAINAKQILSKQRGESDVETEGTKVKEKSESYEMTKEEYAEYQKVKAQNAKKLKQAYKKRTYVSKKREQDTNLAPYAGSRMSSDLQNVIRLTTRKEKYYDKKFIEKVKNGELGTKADVYEYVRKNDMNENTFDLLNKHYFHNQNIASAKQLDQLVEQSARFYALRAAIRSLGDAYDIDVSNYMYGQLNTTMLNQLLTKLKNEAPNAYRIYQDVLSRYQGYRSKSVQDFLSQDLSKMTAQEKADYEKKKKAIESTETKQTQVNTELLKVAYLVGYDGTLESAARVANWARQLALTPELKRTGEVSTISMEKQVKDTKGDNLTIGERIAEQYSFENDFDDFPFANDDVKSMAQELYQSKFAEYLNRLVGKENINLASKELQAILKKKGIDYKTVLAEKQRILDEVANLSTVEVVEQYKSMELTEAFGVNVKVRADLQRQLTQKANRIMDRLKNKKKAYQALVEQFPELGFTTDKEWHMPRKDGKLLNQDEMYVLSKQLSQVLQYANKGAFDPIVQAQKQQIVKQQEMISALKKKQADLQRELKLTKQARKNTYERTEDINFNTTEFTMKSTKPMPEKFKQVLDTVFTKLAKTKGKFTNVNEYHTVKNYDEWVDANIETLSQIDTYEANDILDYLLNSTPLYAKYGSDDYVQYRAISMFMTSYLYARQTELNIDKNLLIQAEEMFDNTRSAAGTLMKVSQGLMDKIDVTGKIMKMLSKQSGVDFRPSDLDDLAHIVDKYKDAKTEAEIKEAMNAYKAQYAKMSERLLRDYKNSDRRTLLNKLVSFQKMAMLSSPGTWIRNITSNFIIQKFDAPMAKLGDFFFNKVAKIADKWDSVGKSKVKKPEFDTTKYSEGLDIATDHYGFEVDYAEGSEFAKWEASVVASIKKAIKWRNDALDVKNAKGDMARYYTEQYHKTQDRITDLKRYLQGDLTVINVTEEELNKRTNKVEEVEKSKAVYEGSDLNATDRFKLTTRLAEAQRLSLMYANPDAIIAESTKAIEAMEEYKIYAKQMQKYEAKVKGNPLRRTLKGQYKLVGTKVDAETAEFVQSMVIDSGLFDLIKDGLNKYNPSTAGNTTETKITRLIMESVMNNVFMNNQFDTKTMNTMSRLLFKVLSDEKWINKTFVSYLGKMLVEDKVDLTQGYSDKVMQTIADAYSYAAYTYMHKANFANTMEKALKERFGDKAFFVYKQIFPFANASINWWIEGLNWTPIGLAKAIKNIINFDNYVGKMESNYALGKGPSQRFASYEIKRTIGKGIVGTAGFFFAVLAASFGLIRLEEDDYGDLKIAIGAGDAEIHIDFTDVTGTTGFGWGLVVGNAFKNGEGIDIATSALNYMFDSSIFSDLYDTMAYNDTVAEWIMEQPERIVKSFIPNIFQVFNSSLYARQIKYSSGALGTLERCAVKMIPGLAYAMPTKYDIYTGELQYKYYPNAMGWIADTISRLGPVKISTAKMSSMERTAMKYGVRRGQLKGDYKDTGKFNTKQVAKLNEMYGSLNKTALADLVNNKKKYRIQDNKTGKYVEKYYSAMTDEERGTIINRIMSENSTYAKIYVWTSEGHKYYTTSSEYTTLAKLGITKNVYRTSNSKQLMNKFVK